MHLKEVKGILSAQNGMNICRGCTHGCIYCDSRSKCYRIEHDFEDVEIKSNAPALLNAVLAKKRNKSMIGTGAMSDPYIPIPESLAKTRECLEIINKCGFGLGIQTKSNLILRDLDLLVSINRNAKCVVQMTMTTYDENLCKIIEPNVCSTFKRFETLRILRDNGIQTVVWLCPFLPHINDTEENLRGLLNYCIEADIYGIICFGIGLTLRDGNREYFYLNLDKYFPRLKNEYQKKYGFNYVITSDNNEMLMRLIYTTCEKHGIVCNNDEVFSFMRTFNDMKGAQLELF